MKIEKILEKSILETYENDVERAKEVIEALKKRKGKLNLHGKDGNLLPKEKLEAKVFGGTKKKSLVEMVLEELKVATERVRHLKSMDRFNEIEDWIKKLKEALEKREESLIDTEIENAEKRLEELRNKKKGQRG